MPDLAKQDPDEAAADGPQPTHPAPATGHDADASGGSACDDRSQRSLLRTKRFLAAISECRRAVVRAPDDLSLLTDVCRILVEHGGYRNALAGFLGGSTDGRLSLATRAGRAPRCLDDHGMLMPSCTPAVRALQARTPVLSWELADESAAGASVPGTCGCDSIVALPLTLAGDGIGAVVIDVEGSLPLEPGEAEALAGLAEDISFGIQTLRSRATQDRDREDLHRNRSRLIALSQAGRQLSRALDVDEVLRCLHGWVRNLLPCSGIIVSSYSPDDQLIRCVFAVMGDHGFDPAEMPPMPVSATGKGLQSSVILSGRPVVVNDYRARLQESSAACYLDDSGRVDADTEQYVDDDESPRSALMVPMILDGEVRGVIQVVTDVEDAYGDEHLELLQALAAPAAVAFSNAELYRRAQEEIVERKRAQEQRAQMEAHIQSTERLNAMGLVAGGVAHDFNNLLTGMVHSIELTRDHVPPGHGGREHLEALAHDAERAAALTRQLLAFSRKQIVSRRRIDISDAVGKTLEMVRRMIGSAITLTWTPCSEPAVVLADPTQLDQVVMNLVVNASDALSGSGTIALSIYCASYDGTEELQGARVPAGDYAVLECRDNGCGIDDQTYGRMFEPFFTTKALGRGTGLGLATVYGIVKQADGFINVESEVGSGSVFRVILPRLPEAEADAEPAAPERAAAPPARRSGRGETILVCDDERSILTTVRRFLTAAGYTVLPAPTPDEAVTLASEFPGTIDLLATDVMMPGCTGPELAKSLVEARPGLRCLFMSGYTADIMRELGAAGVGDDFLGKPFSRDDLLTKVREVLDR